MRGVVLHCWHGPLLQRSLTAGRGAMRRAIHGLPRVTAAYGALVYGLQSVRSFWVHGAVPAPGWPAPHTHMLRSAWCTLTAGTAHHVTRWSRRAGGGGRTVLARLLRCHLRRRWCRRAAILCEARISASQASYPHVERLCTVRTQADAEARRFSGGTRGMGDGTHFWRGRGVTDAAAYVRHKP